MGQLRPLSSARANQLQTYLVLRVKSTGRTTTTRSHTRLRTRTQERRPWDANAPDQPLLSSEHRIAQEPLHQELRGKRKMRRPDPRFERRNSRLSPFVERHLTCLQTPRPAWLLARSRPSTFLREFKVGGGNLPKKMNRLAPLHRRLLERDRVIALPGQGRADRGAPRGEPRRFIDVDGELTVSGIQERDREGKSAERSRILLAAR
jgi:hypothetical protein